MFDKFLNELEEIAKQKGLSGSEAAALSEKYKRRFALALEAGFSESEALEKFGLPENIIDEALKAGEKTQEKTTETCDKNCDDCDKSSDCFGDAGSDYAVICNEFYLENISDKVDIVIAPSDEAGVKTVFDGNVADFYKAKFSDDGFKYEFLPIDENVLKKNKANGTVHILIDKKLFFKRIEISAACGGDFEASKYDFNTDEFKGEFVAGDAVFGDITAKNCAVSCVSGDFICGKIKAGACRISEVSGDVTIGSINAKTLDFSTVSGDMTVENANVENAKLKSVSGDISLEGKVEGYEANTVSGDIRVNQKTVCEGLANKINRSISNIFKSFGKKGDSDDK